VSAIVKLTERISELISTSSNVVREDQYGILRDSKTVGDCLGWISAAAQIVHIACREDSHSPYLAEALRIQERAPGKGISAAVEVRAMAALLQQLHTDIGGGLLVSLERRVSAETFDDLLDHASSYLKEDRKEPAGVIAGVVFEDTIRKLCNSNSISTEDKTLEPLINALTAAGVFDKLEGKEARVAQGIRTSATHALWNEFQADQVEYVIKFTRRLLREKLVTRDI